MLPLAPEAEEAVFSFGRVTWAAACGGGIFSVEVLSCPSSS